MSRCWGFEVWRFLSMLLTRRVWSAFPSPSPCPTVKAQVPGRLRLGAQPAGHLVVFRGTGGSHMTGAPGTAPPALASAAPCHRTPSRPALASWHLPAGGVWPVYRAHSWPDVLLGLCPASLADRWLGPEDCKVLVGLCPPGSCRAWHVDLPSFLPPRHVPPYS